MVVEKNKLSSHWWWLECHKNSSPNRSPWLQSTLAELDEKTKAMLKIIEEDADSFAQRAEMYYKKRPELINMVEDFYRAHRLLAERYDQMKSESVGRLTPWASPLASPLSFTKFRLEKSNSIDKSYDSYSEPYDHDEADESEVDDPEPEEEPQMEAEEERDSEDDEVTKLIEELEILKEENKNQKELLMQKDEEKREVIRQLSLAVDVFREENVQLRKRAVKDSSKKQSLFEFNTLKGGVLWKKLFNGPPKSEISLVNF